MKKFLFILSVLLFTVAGFLYAQDSLPKPESELSEDEAFKKLPYSDAWKESFLKSLKSLLDNSLIPSETLKLVMKYLSDKLPADPLKAAGTFAYTAKKADYALRQGLTPAEVGIKARYSFRMNNKKNIMKNNKAKQNVQSLHVQSVKNRIKYKQKNEPGKSNKPGNTGMTGGEIP